MTKSRGRVRLVEPRDVLEPGQATRFYVATFGGEFFAHATEWTNSIEECLEAVKQNPPPAASLPLQIMSVTFHHLGSVDAQMRRLSHRQTWANGTRRRKRSRGIPGSAIRGVAVRSTLAIASAR